MSDRAIYEVYCEAQGPGKHGVADHLNADPPFFFRNGHPGLTHGDPPKRPVQSLAAVDVIFETGEPDAHGGRQLRGPEIDETEGAMDVLCGRCLAHVRRRDASAAR